MLINRIIKIALLLFGGVYVLLQGLALEIEGAFLGAVLLSILTVLYIGWTKHKSKFFISFLVTFTLGQILGAISWHLPETKPNDINYLYFITNALYILAYVLLILKTIKQLNLRTVFSELTIPILVLVVLDIFCVTLISNTTIDVLTTSQYILEYVYNGVIMALLSIALIDYMYRNNSKSMLFLLATIFITFSEIIQLAYFYILNDENLGFVYALFLIVAFFFFYIQSQYKVTDPVADYIEESLGVENTKA
ncbi:hypothetical protein HNV08_13885 [Winogradskyella eckloniae]|uniref:hypothetical protein n=1 Tax=Winogradskyella eckloniae TaxID=1089306 RepID=UPI001565CAD1|nr:hypothetical protein [Winogradskyella eckloniae]NRD21144.1 hypothetical protein [Winogradskyella eckloniae]